MELKDEQSIRVCKIRANVELLNVDKYVEFAFLIFLVKNNLTDHLEKKNYVDFIEYNPSLKLLAIC